MIKLFTFFSMLVTLVFGMYYNTEAQWYKTNLDFGGNVSSFAISGANVFAGTYGGGSSVLLTADNGESWTVVNNGMPSNVWALAVSGTNIFAGTDHGVFFSTDNGTNWTAINNGLTDVSEPVIKDLAVSGTHIFAAADNGKIIGHKSGVFLSTNNGKNWTAVNNGLENTTVRVLAVSGTKIFAGTNEGVFLTTDNGANWTDVNNGLTETNVYALGISSTNIFAGFGTVGVWTRPLAEMTTPVETPSDSLPSNSNPEQISGTVYNNGEPVEGAIVQVDHGESMMTNADGKYQVAAVDSSRWLKFILFNKYRTLDISDITNNQIDFDFNGRMPVDKRLTIDFDGMDSYVGENLWLSVINKDSGLEIFTERTSVESNFMMDVFGIETGKSYNIDFYVDHNDNGYYDAPPVDHAWRLELNYVTGDTKLTFEPNTNFTNIFTANVDTVNPTAYFIVESMPKFPGGDEGLRKYINQCIIYPSSAKEEGIQGKVYVQFVINEDGTVGNVSVARGADPALDAEAVRIISQLPDWTPGYQGGETVKVQYTVPVNFVLSTSTGLAEKTTADVKIYPNPTSDNIKIELDKLYPEIMVSIKNMAGQEIISKKFNDVDNFQLSMNDLESGIYFIHLLTNKNEQKLVFKVLKD